MSPIDLHVHTNHSHDGDVEPSRIVRTAAEKGIRQLAITDHNRVTAVQPALDAAAGLPVEIIPGIEIDCAYQGVNLHILGYYIDHGSARFSRFWDEIKTRKTALNQQRIDALHNLGYAFDDDAVYAASKDGVISGVTLGRAVLADPRNDANPALAPYRPGAGPKAINPIVSFCWDHVTQGKPAYVGGANPELEAALELIAATGGVPVLAHPGANLAGKESLLPGIIASGVRGVETCCGYHSPEQARFWTDAARQNGAFITCGSDFHGSAKPAIALGEHGGETIADEVAATLREVAPDPVR